MGGASACHGASAAPPGRSRDHRGVGHEAVFGVEAHVVTVDHDREADRLAVGPLVPLPVPAVVLGPPVAAVTVFAGVAGGADEVAVGDRKSVVWGKSVSVRGYLGGRGIIKKKK